MVPMGHLLQFNVTSFLDPQPHRLKRLIYHLSPCPWVAWVVRILLVTLAASGTAYVQFSPGLLAWDYVKPKCCHLQRGI